MSEVENELSVLKAEIAELEKEATEMHRKGYKYESSAIWRKIESRHDKVNDIEKLGMTTKDQKKVIKNLENFTQIRAERDISCRDYEVVGYIEGLGFLRVRYTKYTSFMKNVKGCASLAGKISIHRINKINEKAYNMIVEAIKNHGTIRSTYLFGVHEKNGKIIKGMEDFINLSSLYKENEKLEGLV